MTIAVLAVVGSHFVLMAPAFGPLIGLLGMLTLGNALVGARFQNYSLQIVWAMDGFLKFALGAAMFFGQLLPCLPCTRA